MYHKGENSRLLIFYILYVRVITLLSYTSLNEHLDR